MTSSRQIILKSLTKLVIGLLIIGGVIWWMVRPLAVPPPVEANRVWHPGGYSLICPPNWDRTIEPGPQTPDSNDRGELKLQADQHYWPPTLIARCFRDSPEPTQLKLDDKLVEGSFQGHPASIISGRDHKYWYYRVIFQQEPERWFQLSVSLDSAEEDLMHSRWGDYLNSFRYDPAMAAKASATPAAELKFTTTFPTTSPQPH